MSKNVQIATLGGGCFWCTEAVFQEVKGVEKVISGYAGGNVPGEPTYREICSGLTGHAEVIQITFNANIISYQDIIVIFMTTHDPTTLNQQGPDRGTQYRSIAFYESSIEKEVIEKTIKELLSNKSYYKITTEVKKFKEFYLAEKYHQDYKKKNPYNPYILNVSAPRINKFKIDYSELLK